jgi:O-antigen/teichoic acid export membrane protein
VIRQLINVIGQIALVPILLGAWGDQVYGEWQILAAALTHITLLDFGMQTYVANRMNQCYARGEMVSLTRLLHSALAFSAVVCTGGVLMCVTFVLLAPLNRWFHLTATSRPAAGLVALLLALQAIFSLPAGVLGGLYRAVGEYARDLTINNVYRLAILVLTVAIVRLGGGLVAVAAMQFLLTVITVAFLFCDLQRRHPEIHLGVRERNWQLAFSFLVPSSLFLLMQLSTILTVQGSVLLIGTTLGASTVAVLAALRSLVNVIPQATSSLGLTFWPEFTAMEAKGEYKVLDALHRFAAKGTLWLALCAAVFLHFTGRDIIAWWIGSRIAYDHQLMNSLLLLQIAATLYLMSSLVLSSTNNHRLLAICRLLSSALGLAMGYFLIGWAGAAGAVLGLMIADLATCGWLIPRATCKMLGRGTSVFIKEVFGTGVAFIVVLYAISYVVLKTLPGGADIHRVFTAASTVGVVGTILFYLLWLNREEKDRIRSLVSGTIVPRVLRWATWK